MPHISLASHEMRIRADLREEVEDFVSGLGVIPPASFTADTVLLYRFAHNVDRQLVAGQLRWSVQLALVRATGLQARRALTTQN